MILKLTLLSLLYKSIKPFKSSSIDLSFLILINIEVLKRFLFLVILVGPNNIASSLLERKSFIKFAFLSKPLDF